MLSKNFWESLEHRAKAAKNAKESYAFEKLLGNIIVEHHAKGAKNAKESFAFEKLFRITI